MSQTDNTFTLGRSAAKTHTTAPTLILSGGGGENANGRRITVIITVGVYVYNIHARVCVCKIYVLVTLSTCGAAALAANEYMDDRRKVMRVNVRKGKKVQAT